jgi:hypothetical protein
MTTKINGGIKYLESDAGRISGRINLPWFFVTKSGVKIPTHFLLYGPFYNKTVKKDGESDEEFMTRRWGSRYTKFWIDFNKKSGLYKSDNTIMTMKKALMKKGFYLTDTSSWRVVKGRSSFVFQIEVSRTVPLQHLYKSFFHSGTFMPGMKMINCVAHVQIQYSEGSDYIDTYIPFVALLKNKVNPVKFINTNSDDLWYFEESLYKMFQNNTPEAMTYEILNIGLLREHTAADVVTQARTVAEMFVSSEGTYKQRHQKAVAAIKMCAEGSTTSPNVQKHVTHWVTYGEATLSADQAPVQTTTGVNLYTGATVATATATAATATAATATTSSTQVTDDVVSTGSATDSDDE